MTGERMDYQKRIGTGIRSLLRARHAHVRDLMPVLGVSENQVHARLTGSTKLSLDELAAIADYFKCTPADLLARADELALIGQNWKYLSPAAA